MKINLRLFIILLGVFTLSLNAQKAKDKAALTKDYNQSLIQQQTKLLSKKYALAKKEALAYAKKNNLETVLVDENGIKSYLEYIDEGGNLIYLTAYSAGSAITSNVNQLYEGGSLGLDLSGEDIIVGVWDDGRARSTHQELVGKITHFDDSPFNPFFHSTHVTGTIVSTGINPNAKGMAPNASVYGYNFEDDYPEMQIEAGDGLLVSNHSYGFNPAQLPDWIFGAYIDFSRDLDLITNSAPYYLPVFAVGNSRSNQPPFNASKNEFDLISGRQIAKNALTVANVFQVDNYTGTESVSLNSRSSWGPTDDLRIKPDISAKGTNVLSTTNAADDTYTEFSGTSMAAPAVTGTVALLQELNFKMNGFYLKSHTMKALLCGTTLPAGEFGPAPDVKFGFGLMNAEKAADVILNNGFNSHFEENTLDENETYTETFTTLDPSIPIEVTIAWNDPAGPIQPNGIVDVTDPRLINDLDLRVFDENGNEIQPYFIESFALDHVTATGDNNVDNIEKIHIANPIGEYSIQVTHKGNLTGGSQDFALVITGVGNQNFNIVSTANEAVVCPAATANFQFNYSTIPSFNQVVNFQITGLPDQVTASFSPSGVNENTIVDLELANLNSLIAGEYNFQVVAQEGDESASTSFVLHILEGVNFETLAIEFPTNASDNVQINPTYSWGEVDSASEYLVELSQDNDFSTIIASQSTSNTFITFDELESNTTYYWRVQASNECLVGNFTQNQFTTETLFCNNIVEASDLPISINETINGVYESAVTVANDFVGQISKLTVSVGINHTNAGDLILTLVSPSGTEVVLVDQECDGSQNINATFDDAAPIFSCSETILTISGIIRPDDSLSEFIGEEVGGDWTLRVEDVSFQDGGSINSFEIEFCDGTSTFSTASFNAQEFQIYPNPASSTVHIDFENITSSGSLQLLDLNGRLIERTNLKPSLHSYPLDVSGLNGGVYIVLVEMEGMLTSKKLIVR